MLTGAILCPPDLPNKHPELLFLGDRTRNTLERNFLRTNTAQNFHRFPRSSNMVNTGHPSNGCGTCRIKRIRCDETEPTCTNCVRSKRVCLGYRTQQVAHQQFGIMSDRASRQRSELGISLRRVRTNSTNLERKALTFASDSGVQDATIDQQSDLQALPDISRYVPAQHSLNRATSSTLGVTDAGFQSLQELAQSLDERKQLHEKYQLAMRELRNSISSPPYSETTLRPICLFALYEVRSFNLRQRGEKLITHSAR